MSRPRTTSAGGPRRTSSFTARRFRPRASWWCCLRRPTATSSKWEDAERFDIHRNPAQIFTFSFGPHFCLGANLAKIEGRIALETILPRIPEWTVDYDEAALTKGIDTRGWERLPVTVG